MRYIENTSIETIAKNIGEEYNETIIFFAGDFLGKDAAGMLDISHAKISNKDYIKDAVKFNNYLDKKLIKYQDYLRAKLKTAFNPYNFDINKIEGYYFPPNSEPSIRITKDVYFKEFLKNNKENLLKGNKDLSINFKTGNMYYAHHLADVLDYELDSEGNLLMIIADTNDFNPDDPSKLVQAGEIAMREGYLKPLFILKEVKVQKTELDKI